MMSSIRSIENRTYYYLCGFALCSSLSIGGGSVFLGLLILNLLHRLYRKHDDLSTVVKAHGRLLAIIGILIVAMLISIPFSLEPIKGVTALLGLYKMGGFAAVLLCIHEKQKLLRLAGLAAFSLVLNDVIEIGQGILCIMNGHNPVAFRCSGVMFYMAQATLLSMSIPIAFLAVLKVKSGKPKYLAIGILLIALLALIINGTRGAWLTVAFSMMLVLYLYVQDKRKFVVGCLVAMVLAGGAGLLSPAISARVVSMTDMNYQSNSERLLLWQSAYRMFEDHPLTGIGLAQFKKVYQEEYISPLAKEPGLTHAHNNVIHMLAECGLIGGIAFLLLWGYLTYIGISGWHATGNIGYLCILALVTGLMVHGLTEYTWGRAVSARFFWFTLALALQWIQLSKENKEQ